jgi:ubiquinone/menaquinone biosynthesis C-methylase UbiE
LPFPDGSFDCLVCVDALNYFAEDRFVSEVVRVLRPSGRLLLAEVSATLADAEARFLRIADSGGLTMAALRDVSEGARRSVRERSPRASRALGWVPAFLHARVAEMLALEGSERYRRWQDGKQCLALAVLCRPEVAARAVAPAIVGR